MRIEIEHKSPLRAAAKIKKLMAKHGGKWIVNSVGDEGFVMCRVGTLAGRRLELSGADCLAGTYDSQASLVRLSIDLRLARKQNEALHGEDGEREPFVPVAEIVLEHLCDRDMMVRELVDVTGQKQSTLENAIVKLRERGLVKGVRGPRGKVVIYSVAA